VLALAVAGAVFGIATAVQAAIPDAQGVIHGCYQKVNGQLRVVDTAAGQSCNPSELPLNWSQKGTTGARGPTGTKGTTGDRGPTGATGPASLAALQGSPCTIDGSPSTVDVSVDQGTGAISLTCTPLIVVSTQEQQQYCSPNTCWGFVIGHGLKPGAAYQLDGTRDGGSPGVVVNGSVAGNGTISLPAAVFACGVDWHDVYATSTAANGTPVTSATVQSPCG
jgi:hypothetical protein